MKQITLKTTVTIDGVEHILSTCDYSESIADYQKDLEETISDDEIIEFIKEDFREWNPF